MVQKAEYPPLSILSWVFTTLGNSQLVLGDKSQEVLGVTALMKQKMRSLAGLQAPFALSGDQKCPHSGSGEEPHGKLVDKGDISKHIWGQLVEALDCADSGCNLSQPNTDVENRADESCPKSVCLCWLQREPGVTSSAGNVCIVDTWSQVREIPHLPLLHLCFLPGTLTSQDKRLSQAPGLPNPALSCLNKWQQSAE